MKESSSVKNVMLRFKKNYYSRTHIALVLFATPRIFVRLPELLSRGYGKQKLMNRAILKSVIIILLSCDHGPVSTETYILVSSEEHK